MKNPAKHPADSSRPLIFKTTEEDHTEAFRRWSAPGCRVRLAFLPTPEGHALRVIRFSPEQPPILPPVLFVPGLASVLDNFTGTLRELTRHALVYYLETREKSSSRLKGRADFSLPALARDVIASIQELELKTGEYILAGYSLGAAAILEGLPELPANPAAVILTEPNASFPFPSWLLFLARFATFLYRPVKPFLKWYIRTFRVDMENDRELYDLNCRILDQADPKKISAVVRAISTYQARPQPPSEPVPVLVIGASKDLFHNFDDSRGIAEALPGSTYLDMETNARTHGPEWVHELIRFIGPGKED